MRPANMRWRYDLDFPLPSAREREKRLLAAIPEDYRADVVAIPEHLRIDTARQIKFRGRKRGLPASDLLILEGQYIAWCVITEAQVMIRSHPFHRFMDLGAAARADTFMERSVEEWSLLHRSGQLVTPLSSNDRGMELFLRYGQARLARLYDDRDETAKDVWDLAYMGFKLEDVNHRLWDFRDLSPMLRDLIKKWTQHRLNTGTHPNTVKTNIDALGWFDKFCTERGVTDLSQLGRERVLVPYVSRVHAQGSLSASTRNIRLRAVTMFLDAIRRNDWAELPPDAALYYDERVRQTKANPRNLEDDVVAQIEMHLPKMDNELVRRMVGLLLDTGRRISEIVRCPIDCLTYDNVAEPWLKYVSYKANKEHAIPLGRAGARPEQIILEQQAWVAEHFPDSPYLFPSPQARFNGQRPYAHNFARTVLRAWTEEHNITDRRGKLVRLTPHVFRHTIATRMINNGVKPEAIQAFLGHDTLTMTMLYAQVRDATVKEAYLNYQVNIAGERVALAPAGLTAEDRWLKTQMANQALPNGHCGLPARQDCPHANACLTCDHFSTDITFLPTHRRQLGEAEELVADARRKGHTRVAEMNSKVVVSLTSIIDSLETLRHAANG